MWAGATFGATLVCFAGVAVVIAGLRGRRVGDHPHCRACGFDLFGGPTGPRKCPECGAAVDVAAGKRVVVGQRVRNKRVLALGVALAFVAGVPAAGLIWSWADQTSWQKLKPTAVLLWETDSARSFKDDAFVELFRREAAGTLSAGQRLTLIRKQLARQQAGPPGWWDQNLTTTLIDLQADGDLPQDVLDQFVRQRWVPGLLVRRAVRATDAVPIEIRVDELIASGVTGGQRMTVANLSAVTIDGRPAVVNVPTRPTGERPSGLMHVRALGLEPGEHTLSVTVRYDVFGPSAPVLPTRQEAKALSGTFRVVAAGEDSVSPPDDGVAAVVAREGSVVVRLHTNSLLDTAPRAQTSGWLNSSGGRTVLAHRVLLRLPDGTERPLGTITGAWASAGIGFVVRPTLSDLGDASLVDIIFRPDLDAARQTATGTEIAGEIVFTGVTVRR